MSASNRYSGAITITPPLTAREIRRAPESSAGFDAHLRITTVTVQTDGGEATRFAADAIVGPSESCSGYDVDAQIQTLVDLYAADHEFAGFIELDPDPGYGDSTPSRYVVRDGRVVEVWPMLVWPAEDGAS